MRILIFLLLSLSGFAQTIDPVIFGAKGNGIADDTKAIQAAIDSAIKVNGTVWMPDKYLTTFPLIACKWDSVNNKYVTYTIRIIGRSRMWDVGGISQITYTGKDGFALGIHLGKGCVIEGLNIQGKYVSPVMTTQQFFQSTYQAYGDSTVSNKQYAPHAGLVIDPFRDTIPPDGGYTALKKYYRGKGGTGGSTGFTINNITFNNLNLGLIFSPNGQTANCELMNVYDIRIYNTRGGIVGCQAQEKSMKLSNINCWGRTHTLFV